MNAKSRVSPIGLLALAAALLTAHAAPASGSPASGPASGPAPPGGAAPASSEEVEETIDLYRVHRMREALSLTDDQTTRVMGILAEARRERRSLHQERGPLMERLRVQIASPTPDAREIGRALEELEALRRRQDESEERLRVSLKKVLDPVQQAKLVFFTLRFERELQDRVDTFRELRRGRTGPRGERGPRGGGGGGAGR